MIDVNLNDEGILDVTTPAGFGGIDFWRDERTRRCRYSLVDSGFGPGASVDKREQPDEPTNTGDEGIKYAEFGRQHKSVTKRAAVGMEREMIYGWFYIIDYVTWKTHVLDTSTN